MGFQGHRMIDVFGRASLTADDVADAMRRGNVAFDENTAHIKEADALWATANKRLKVLGNEFKETAHIISDKMDVAVSDLVEEVITLVKTFNHMLETNPEVAASIDEIVQSVIDFIGSITDYIKENPKFISEIAAAAVEFGAMSAKLGPILIGLSVLLELAASAIIVLGGMSGAARAVATKGFSFIISAGGFLIGILTRVVGFIGGPLTAAFVAIAIGATHVATHWEETWGNAKKLFFDVWRAIKDGASAVLGLLVGDFEGFFNFVVDGVRGMLQTVSNLPREVANQLGLGAAFDALFGSQFGPQAITDNTTRASSINDSVDDIGGTSGGGSSIGGGSSTNNSANFSAPLIVVENVNASNEADVKDLLNQLGAVCKNSLGNAGFQVGTLA